MRSELDIVFLGLSITSSWGNGHATTYRALVRALDAAGHRVLFLERDRPWYASQRDLPSPGYCDTALYGSLEELDQRFRERVARADLVVVGSYVPEGDQVGDWVLEHAGGLTAFYDIDTPVTMARLARDHCAYLRREQVERYDLYLSFTGGRVLGYLERALHAPCARALYCSADPDVHAPDPGALPDLDLGYMGTYSADRQPPLQELLLAPAQSWPGGRFCVAGANYPASVVWPPNVRHIEHLAPARHRAFYTRQRYTLNLTRAAMRAWGWSPSVRLFEAGACGTPVISDDWPGMKDCFTPGEEVLLARSSGDVLACLREIPEDARARLGERMRRRVLAQHTPAHRAEELMESVRAAREQAARAS